MYEYAEPYLKDEHLEALALGVATGMAYLHSKDIVHRDLKVLPIQDCYKYMKLQHDATQVAVILGKCASHLGQMDRALTRLCCLHLPTFLPATDMEIPSPVQCAAVVGLGLNYVGSAQRRTVELLSAEIGKREQPDRPLPERESYALAAGFAFGLVYLHDCGALTQYRKGTD